MCALKSKMCRILDLLFLFFCYKLGDRWRIEKWKINLAYVWSQEYIISEYIGVKKKRWKIVKEADQTFLLSVTPPNLSKITQENFSFRRLYMLSKPDLNIFITCTYIIREKYGAWWEDSILKGIRLKKLLWSDFFTEPVDNTWSIPGTIKSTC